MDDPDDRKIITTALAASMKRVKEDFAAGAEGSLAAALLALGKRSREVRFRDLEDGIGEKHSLSNRGIGGVARRMGLKTRHTNSGTAIIVDDDARRLMEDLLR